MDRAASSEHGLELAARHSYDAILCDLNLESGSGLALFPGFDLHDRICEKAEGCSGTRPLFIFMSGDLVETAVGEHAGGNANRFLQKPFRMADLLALLEEVPAADSVLQPKNSST